ncbi:MAG TPA: hydantoinase/oxoprolinase N-terminal domain-containing protein [Beijerinckiaceae bacterium]|nr:hydantoinase/oxoprolinase N-terminal domain-containing protein [Beijerinckiaceae bacterium]
MGVKTDGVRIGIDIGGTFTDLQILNERTGALASLKTPTTPEDPSIGLIAGIEEAAGRFGFDFSEIRLLLHGTTIATNAVLERKLAKGVLVTTEGFRDVLEIGRHVRRDVYGLKPKREPALIPRHRRVAVAERIRADGKVERPLEREAIEGAIAAIRALAETVAISLLNSNVNPAHERALRDGILNELPGFPVSISSEVSPRDPRVRAQLHHGPERVADPGRALLSRAPQDAHGRARASGAASPRAVERGRVQPGDCER